MRAKVECGFTSIPPSCPSDYSKKIYMIDTLHRHRILNPITHRKFEEIFIF